MRNIVWSAALLLALPQILPAQSRLSEKAITTQIVNGTTITIEYYRPVTRGRSDLFGKQVHWGEIWTPGANWATTFETDRDLYLNGNLVPKGKYSMWMVTAQDSPWTFFLHKTARRFHTQRPKADSDSTAVRFPVQPTTGPVMEALLFYFPNIQKDTATLHMHWATTVVSLRVVTTALPQLALTEEQRRELPGEYEIVRASDSVKTKARISEEDGKLFYTSGVGGTNEMKTPFIRFGEHMFRRLIPGDNNQPGENMFVFKKEADGTISFEAISAETKVVFGKGTRIK